MVAREVEVGVEVGGRAELECVAHGNPPPAITWRRQDGNNIQVAQPKLNQNSWLEIQCCALEMKRAKQEND